MKNHCPPFAWIFLGLLSSAIVAAPPDAAFTYQGRLTDGGRPASGIYDLRFAIYDSAGHGNAVGRSITNALTLVSNGLFSVTLDFGAGAFDGAARWLEIGVRTNGNPGPHTALAGRQPLSPTPYSLHANHAANLMSFANAPLDIEVYGQRAFRLEHASDAFSTGINVIGGHSGNVVSNGVVGGTIAGGGTEGAANWVGDDFATIGGGVGNASHGLGATVGGGMYNDAAGPVATVSGGQGNGAAESSSTVSGGSGNIAIGTGATIGGGEDNLLLADRATIAGGDVNYVGTNASYAAIGGGSFNVIQAGASYSVIGGGQGNVITGPRATVPGGRLNVATNAAFAAGTRARARHTGAFVWGDSTDADITSTNANSATFRVAGGIRLFSDADATSGVFLAPGAGSWTSLSDVHTKENFRPVDSREVMEQVARLPVQTWNYKSQGQAIRHLGPVAQDFKAAFGLGESDTGITSVDADGVALAAIQGLNMKLDETVRARDRRIEALEWTVTELKQLVQELARREPGGTR